MRPIGPAIWQIDGADPKKLRIYAHTHIYPGTYSYHILVPQTSQSMTQVDCESADLAKLHVLIDNLPALCNSLPSSVPQATDSDLIHQVTTTITGKDPWHTFNWHFDILFGEDCQDDNGRLHHLKQGPLGMGAVCTYLNNLDLDDTCFMHDLMVKKLTCVVKEVIYLMYVWASINKIELTTHTMQVFATWICNYACSWGFDGTNTNDSELPWNSPACSSKRQSEADSEAW